MFETGFSDFLKMVVTVMNTSYNKIESKIRSNHQDFPHNRSVKVLKTKLSKIITIHLVIAISS